MWYLVLLVTLPSALGQGCGEYLTTPTGEFTTPNYPEDYPNSTLCNWNIQVLSASHLYLQFEDLELEQVGGICRDRVDVWDLAAPNPLLARVCGDTPPGLITTASSSIFLNFQSDDSTSFRGFKVSYTSERLPMGVSWDCYTGDSIDYRGTVRVTETGKTCQRWDRQTPHNHNFRPDVLTDRGLDENFCRKPDGNNTYYTDHRPWCYTTNPSVRWEYCDITPCEDGVTPTVPTTTVSTTTVSTVPPTPDYWTGSTLAPNASECGVPSIPPITDSTARIIGGMDSRPGSWPWQVSLWQLGYDSHVCGASLIGRQWVLTAAHCVERAQNPTQWKVRVGSYTREVTDPNQQEYDVKHVIMHPRYDTQTLDNDIALIQLNDPVTISAHVQPVCISAQEVPEGYDCYVTGWGDTLGSGSDLGYFLQQARIQVIDTVVCNQWNWYNNDVTDNMVCAGYEAGGVDACQGDSGGPMVCQSKDGTWYQAGVVSWGHGCAQAKKPGVYTKVARFVHWLDHTMSVHDNDHAIFGK
ncbi:plasminogen-like [Branchiostoma lanceolatum]|uniref:plasminogen-like n=1 Tax=Branchiostoma lanceolatum TaxID=7740 RepID=UPI003452E356